MYKWLTGIIMDYFNAFNIYLNDSLSHIDNCLTCDYDKSLPCTVLMQWRPEVPFLALTTLSVLEMYMYLVPPTVTPFIARSSVLP